MADTPVLNNLSAVRFQQARVMNIQHLAMIVAPQFTPDQIAVLQQNPAATVRSIDQKLWLTLTGWLDSVSTAVVQCRRSGLTVQLSRKNGISGTLLPAGANSPSAILRFKSANGSQQQRPLQTLLDATNGYLRLTLLFENSSVYDELLTAMTTPAAEAAIDIAFVHPYQLKISTPQPGPRPNPPVILRPRGAGGAPIIRTMPAHVSMARNIGQAAAVARPQFQNAELVAARTNPRMAEIADLTRVDMRRVVVRPQPQPQGDTSILQDQSYSNRLTLPLTHTRTETAVFPDLPRQSQNGWGQVPRNPKLHFRDSGRADTFYYLPTNFKLGYYFERGAGAVGARPPLRVELYRNSGGDERIKATVVALPCIEDAERTALRTFLHDNLLQGLQPFIFLEPRSGLQAKFVDDFSAGTASDQRTLPAEITLQAVEVASEDRMVLRFDMPALKYPIFCELLKAGMFGRVMLFETGLEAQIEVRIQLENIVTNLVNIEQAGPTEPPATSPPQGANSLTIRNMLDYAVQISSLTLNLLDRGELTGMVFEAEDLRLLPTGAELPPQSDQSSALTFPVKPQRLIAWDETVVEAGQIKVLGGSADDWLNRVNRDPSLQQHEFKVRLQLIVSAAIRDRVQLIRLRLLKEGDPAIRARMDLTPDVVSPVLQVPMTLQELMGTAGKPPSFSIEYETLAADGNLSLPQRVAISPEVGTVVLRAILQTPNTIFTVEHQTETGAVREELSREAAEQLISQLRSGDKRWEIFTKEPPPPDHVPRDPAGPLGPEAPASTGSEVTIVMDLAAIALGNGSLTRIFVVLKPDQGTGSQSSFVFDSSHQSQATWRPQGFTVPPFRYEITYLYAGNQVREVNGTSSNLTLILDPPALT